MAKYKWDNLILFMEQLSTAAQLNLPLDKTIESMSRESLDRGWQKAQESVSELVRLGSPLSEAMGNYPQYFPAMVRRLVWVGEEGKVLPRMLGSLGGFIQSAREIQHRLQKCMIYPLIVWSLLLLDTSILVIFVLPKILDMFGGLGGLKIFPNIAFITIAPSFLVLGGGFLLFFAWIVIGWLSADMEGASGIGRFMERIVGYIPFIGNLHRHAKAAEICDMLGILVEGGHGGREAILVAKNAVNSLSLQMALDEVETAMVSGQPYVSQEKRSLIPPTSLWMISQSGASPELGKALQGIARYHRRQADTLSTILRELIEPLLILSIAILGGMTVISIYTAIFRISSTFMVLS